MKLTGLFFRSNFRDVGQVMPVVFGKYIYRFGYEKRPTSIFGKAITARKFG